jgi:cytochrome c oxidase cbb3-type subunit 3
MRKLAMLLPLLLAAAASHAADAAKGKAVYDAKCASCHGKDGKGNAAMGKVFKTEPAALDLTDAATAGKSDADLKALTDKGLNKMPAFAGKLSPADLDDVTAYTRSLSGAAPVAAAPAAAVSGEGTKSPDLSATWTAKCASCHGKDGKGNANMAKVFKLDAAALDMVDEATLAKSDAELVRLTTEGVGKMPAYKDKMTAQEIEAIVKYMRSLGMAK